MLRHWIVAALCCALSTLSSCRLYDEVRFVDPDGRPIEGVLVLSHKTSKLIGPVYNAATVSDAEGYAVVADGFSWSVFRRGYHGIEDGLVTRYRLHDAFDIEHDGEIVLWPSDRRGPSDFEHDYIPNPQTSEGQDGSITELLDGQVRVFTEFDSWDLTLEARNGVRLLPSRRFWFEGPSDQTPVTKISARTAIAAYVLDKEGNAHTKINVRVGVGSGPGWLGGKKQTVWKSPLDILRSKVSAEELAVRPPPFEARCPIPWGPTRIEPSSERVLAAIDSEIDDPKTKQSTTEFWEGRILGVEDDS